MKRRRGSESGAPRRHEETARRVAAYSLNSMWIAPFMSWADDAADAEWPGPRPEMIAAALELSEIAAARARMRRAATA
jgi:hypothetical protein